MYYITFLAPKVSVSTVSLAKRKRSVKDRGVNRLARLIPPAEPLCYRPLVHQDSARASPEANRLGTMDDIFSVDSGVWLNPSSELRGQ
jgi:hypothetical protein